MDLNFFLTPIFAKSPLGEFNGSQFLIPKQSIEPHVKARRHSKVYECFYNIGGVRPPVNNIGYYEKDCKFNDSWGGLTKAHALFKGITRPYINGNLDETVYIYVIKPKFVYKYEVSMVCPARRINAPEDAVFCVYVNFADQSLSKGIILGWEWVFADKSGKLPDDHENRYSERVW